MYKYVYKGYDCTNLQVTTLNSKNQKEKVDECSQFLDLRYVSAPEAIWRIFEFPMHQQSHTIQRLAVHLKDQQTVYFEHEKEKEAIIKAQNSDTTLTAWFKLNAEDESARKYLYHEIPNQYSFFQKKWKLRRLPTDDVIGRMYMVSPREGERYYLRMLLLHVSGNLKNLKLYFNVDNKLFHI